MPLRCRPRSSATAWDGDWYRRGYFDDGTPLGSAASEECRIDSIAQSWAVLSGAADRERATRAMAAVERELIRRKDGLALLFAPPFDKTPLDPGYIKGYPPGIRENGGQYTHAALWSVMAFAALGEGDKAAGLFSLLNPINHARSAGRRAPLQGGALCRRRRCLCHGAACRAWRLDLVHGLGRLDAARRASRASSGCASAAGGCTSIPASPRRGRVLRCPFDTARPDTRSRSKTPTTSAGELPTPIWMSSRSPSGHCAFRCRMTASPIVSG